MCIKKSAPGGLPGAGHFRKSFEELTLSAFEGKKRRRRRFWLATNIVYMMTAVSAEFPPTG